MRPLESRIITIRTYDGAYVQVQGEACWKCGESLYCGNTVAAKAGDKFVALCVPCSDAATEIISGQGRIMRHAEINHQ